MIAENIVRSFIKTSEKFNERIFSGPYYFVSDTATFQFGYANNIKLLGCSNFLIEAIEFFKKETYIYKIYCPN